MNFLKNITGINTPIGGVTFKWDENRVNEQAYFLVGCSIGNKIALLPLEQESMAGIDELKNILDRKSEFKDLAQKLSALLPKLSKLKETKKDISKQIAEHYFTFFEEMYICGKAKGTKAEVFYLNLGKLLFEIPTLIATGGEVPSSYIYALQALSENQRIPNRVCEVINEFCSLALKKNKELLNLSNEIALTINLII